MVVRAGDDRAGAERARAELHAAGIDRAGLAGADQVDRGLDRPARQPPHPGGAQRLVDRAVVVLAEIDIVEPVAVLQPGLGAVARVQERERGADRQAVVAHRRKDEHLVERQCLGEQPVQPHIGEQAAGEREPRAPLRASHQRTDFSGEVLRDLLDRRRDRLAVVSLADRQELLAHRRPVAEVGFDQPVIAVEAELAAISSASFGSP